MMTCVRFVTKTLTPPDVPAGRMAALATTRPSREFSVETIGCCCPAGQIDRYDSGSSGTTVTLTEYACALAGMLQGPAGNWNVRTLPALIIGGPNWPACPDSPRVS